MTKTPAELLSLKREAQASLSDATTPDALETWRVRYLGRKGVVPLLLREIKKLLLEERKEIGQVANQLRRELEELYESKKQAIQRKPIAKKDLGIGHWELGFVPLGHFHPITLTIRHVQDILAALGFEIVGGPEVEQEYYDFDALNIPFQHPARAETDSFYLEPRRPQGQGLVLRSSTSAVQVRSVIENHLTPPFKIASPGRVFRNEKVDATHESTFHQFEGLAVGESITLADLKSVIEALYSTFFNQAVNIRFRPGFFPFVEPGLEVDMSCPFCKKGCRVCKYTRWVEIMGAGMVHPNVLRNMNVDPAQYQGYAFGGAVDRLAMLQYGIDDIRLFWSGDIRFLRQFS